MSERATAPAAVFHVGSVRVDVVSDGHFLQDGGAVFGIVPRTLWEPHTGAPDERYRIRLALNCLLVRDGHHTVLVDTGAGNKIEPRRRETAFPGDYGHLLEGLAALGVHPPDITAVVNTHLHFDHCGWNTAVVHGALIPTFPNARYYVQRAEWKAATHPNERTRATYMADNLTPLADSGQLELAEGELQVTPSVRLLPAPGHSDGHAVVVLSSGGETGIYMGDVVQHAAQIDRPAWVSAFDILPLVSMETKKRLVRQALDTGALVLTTHAPYPGAGRIREEDGRPRYMPI
jgi:glyoxylase-like metal-dependent hydrolase (beta-lactamase superfamily II)